MQTDGLGLAVLQPIEELFVVAKVEALLLQLPFQIPVRLSDKEKAGMALLDGGNQIGPILRFGSRSGTVSPGALEN